MSSKSWKAALIGGAMIAVLSVGAGAQQSPRELFERAKLLEQSGRQSARVVAMYEEVATKADRPLAAAARLQIALLKEREGKPEARALYAAIVRDYPDQRDVVLQAQSKLAAKTGGRAGRSDVVPRRVLEGGWAGIIDIAANGRLAVGWERAGYSARNLLVRDMESGTETVLVAGGPSGTGGQARISPDGRRVAFDWSDMDDGSKTTGSSLRVLPIEGGPVETILTNATDTSMRPSGWSPDGKRLLVNVHRFGKGADQPPTARELAWVSLQDRSVQTLKAEEPWRNHYPERLSPDGRFIAYVAPPARDSSDRYLYVLDTQTLRETAVVTDAGDKSPPVWTADGTHLIYAEGSALKSVAIHDGAGGEIRTLQSGFSGRTLGFTAAGVFYYEQSVGGGNYEFITSRNPSPAERPVVFPGLSASWSRDGRFVAFVRGAVSNPTLDLIVRDVVTGTERSYQHPGIGVQSPRWIPDGTGVLAIVNDTVDGKREPAVYRVELATGSFQRLFALRTASHLRPGVGALSPDGRTLYLGIQSAEGAPVTGIVGVDLATGSERPIVSFPSVERATDFGIAVGPDGSTLAVSVRVKAFATARIFTVAVDGSNYRDVVGPFATGWLWDQLRWTPDGRTLVFTVFDAKKNWRIMRVPVEGGTPEFDGVSYDVISALLPSFRLWPGNFNNIDLSPDGSRIITSALTSVKNEIWTLDGVMSALRSR